MLHIDDVVNWQSHTQSLLAFWSAGQLRVFRDNPLSKLVFVNKIFSANLSSIYISWVDCSFSLFRCARCFQPYMNTACRSTQNAACTKRTKTLKYKHINKILLNWSVNLVLSMFFQTLDSSLWFLALAQKWEPAGRIGDFEKFSNVFAKSPLLPCVPHRSRLFLLNRPEIVEFFSWKRFIMWSIL